MIKIPTPRRQRAAPRRDQLVTSALALFVREGFHDVGIDRILAEAGVAKMTLYKHFRSKDDLIVAALMRRDSDYRNWLMREVGRQTDKPDMALVAYVDAVRLWCCNPDFNGCTFINAAAEFRAPDHPVHRAAAEHKQAVFAFVENLAKDAGLIQPKRVAMQVRLLVDGATVMKQTTGSEEGFLVARDSVAVLVAAAVRK